MVTDLEDLDVASAVLTALTAAVAVDVLMDSVVAVADSLAVDATVTDIKKY
jgi:hypothetical protein